MPITSTRCKFTVQSIEDFGHGRKIYSLNAVYYEPLTKEDRAFSKATPDGSMKVTIENPAVQELLKVGQKVWVDITPVD